MLDRRSSLSALPDVLEDSVNHNDMARLHGVIKALTKETDLHTDAIDVIANVGHFLSDGKVRKRNQERREMQETEMRQLIDALRDGRSRDELLDYTLLG